MYFSPPLFPRRCPLGEVALWQYPHGPFLRSWWRRVRRRWGLVPEGFHGWLVLCTPLFYRWRSCPGDAMRWRYRTSFASFYETSFTLLCGWQSGLVPKSFLWWSVHCASLFYWRGSCLGDALRRHRTYQTSLTSLYGGRRGLALKGFLWSVRRAPQFSWQRSCSSNALRWYRSSFTPFDKTSFCWWWRRV
jgi:hypothetical protein